MPFTYIIIMILLLYKMYEMFRTQTIRIAIRTHARIKYELSSRITFKCDRRLNA